ncbi:MAG: PIN domain-containing protein [Bryobacteraceae bacterium]
MKIRILKTSRDKDFVQPLLSVPDGSDVFIDANIFIYGLTHQSPQCLHLLERCSREEVTGISLFEIVNEATHRFMLAEATSKGVITKGGAAALRQQFSEISHLIDYWHNTERLLALNLLFFSTDERIVRNAQPERQSASVLTNDSMILSWMREYGLQRIATGDHDFERASGITVFGPDDI